MKDIILIFIFYVSFFAAFFLYNLIADWIEDKKLKKICKEIEGKTYCTIVPPFIASQCYEEEKK